MKTSFLSALTLCRLLNAALGATNNTSNTLEGSCHKDDFPDLSGNVSVASDSYRFSLNGQIPAAGNTTIELVLRSKDDEIYHQVLDPCAMAMASLSMLCPSIAGPLELQSSIQMPPGKSVEESEPDLARMYINITVVGGRVLKGCFEQALAEENVDDTGNQNSTTSSNGDSGSENGNQNATTTENGDGHEESNTSDTASDNSSETSESSGHMVSPGWEGTMVLAVGIFMVQILLL